MYRSLSPYLKNTISKELTGIICVLLAGCIWGLSGIVGQYALQEKHISAQWMLVVRMGLPAIILLAFSYQRHGLIIFDCFKNKVDAFRLVFLAILGMWISQLTFYLAVQHSNAASATILQYLYPVIVALLATFHSKQVPSYPIVISIILAIIGVFLLITNGNLHQLILPKYAVVLGLLSALTTAIYTLYSVPLLKQYNSVVIAGWSMLIGGIAANFFHPFWNIPHKLDFEAWLSILFLVFIGGMMGFILFLIGIKNIGGTKASVLSTVKPLATVIFSVIILDLHFTLFYWIGAVCIISMILILSIKTK